MLIIGLGQGFTVQGSAPPLTAEAVSLIEKETPALRSHIRGLFQFSSVNLYGVKKVQTYVFDAYNYLIFQHLNYYFCVFCAFL